MTDAEHLLATLLAPGDWIEFRSIRPGAGGKVHEWHRCGGDLTGVLAKLREANEGGDHCFFGVNPRRDVGGSRAADVLLARSLFVDFDRSVGGEPRCSVGEALHRIREINLPEPSVVMTTGAGVHAYWLLDEPMHDLGVWTRTQKALIRDLRTDRGIHDPPRCMRLPGFANVKYPAKPVACLVHCQATAYPIEEFPEPVEARQPSSGGVAADGSTMSELARRFISEGQVLPDGRRATVFTVACDLAARGWQFEAAEAAIMGRAERLSLTADEIADLPRQIRNAYSQRREPILDEPVRVVPAGSTSPPAEADASPEADEPPPSGDRLISLTQAIGKWKEHKREEAIRVVPLFRGIMPQGLPTGQIVCIAAPPALGKTAIALQLVTSALMLDPSLVAIWCMGEMTEDRLAERIIACNAPMQIEDVRDRCRLAVEHADAIASRIGERLQILPDPLRTGEIEASVEKTGARLVVVDYLQLVRGQGRQQERRQEVDGALRDLRTMTTQRRLAMVVISNLAKGVTRLENPGSIDVGKESSEIAFQADLVLYGTSPGVGLGDGTLVEWHCLKNRHGESGTTELVFLPRQQRFAPSVDMAR